MTTKMKTLAASVAVALSSGSLLSTAFADDVYNKVDGSVDASIETVNLVKGGADAVVDFSVAAKDGDGVTGCNLSTTSSLTVNVESSHPAVATVTPATLTFTNCTDVKSVTVKPLTTGHADITLSQTASTSGGFFNLSGAAFVAVVAELPDVDTTPPVITSSLSANANTNGWHNDDVKLTWTVTDAESTILAKRGCDVYTQTSDAKRKTITCTATSAGGTSKKSVTIKLDDTNPVIRIKSPKNEAEYDLNESVKVSWSAHDKHSGIASSNGTLASGMMLNTSTAGEFIFSVTATDKAGNTSVATKTYTVLADTPDDDDENTDDEDDEDTDNHQGDRSKKVTVCHKGKHSITIGKAALKAHLKHGSTVGDCDEDND